MKKVEIYPRDFEGVWIPKEIYLHENLNALDKIIFAEINSLDNHLSGGDYCFASNEYLAKFCGCSIRKVSEQINKLVSMGYLRIVRMDGRKRWIESCYKSGLANFANQPSRNENVNARIAENSIRVAENAIQNGKNCQSVQQEMLYTNIPYNNNYKNSNNISSYGGFGSEHDKRKCYARVNGNLVEVDSDELPFS